MQLATHLRAWGAGGSSETTFSFLMWRKKKSTIFPPFLHPSSPPLPLVSPCPSIPKPCPSSWWRRIRTLIAAPSSLQILLSCSLTYLTTSAQLIRAAVWAKKAKWLVCSPANSLALCLIGSVYWHDTYHCGAQPLNLNLLQRYILAQHHQETAGWPFWGVQQIVSQFTELGSCFLHFLFNILK